MSIPVMEMLRQQIALGRASGQKEYYVQVGPLPEVAALSLQSVLNERGSPVEVRLIEATSGRPE